MKSVADTSRMGRVMIVVAWILALGLLTGLFQQLLDRQSNPNAGLQGGVTDGGVREVRLERSRSGHYLAPGYINGVPVEFLLDTGATGVSVAADLADRIGLRRGAAGYAETANGRIRVYRTQLDEVVLGSIRMTNVSGFVNPGGASGQVLLGMSFLKHLELVQRGNTLTLRQHSAAQ